MHHLINALTRVFVPSSADQGPHQRFFKTEFTRDYRNFVRSTGREPSELESRAFVSRLR